jgi:hypothetical protein
MRSLAWGILFLLLSTCGALAQVTGKVETIGWDNTYRQSMWTPLRVRLAYTGSGSASFELRVSQRDAEGDVARYSTTIALDGNAGDRTFWTYFIPTPIAGGLPDGDMDRLRDTLKVTVHDAAGRELVQLPMPTALPKEVDAAAVSPNNRLTRGGSLVVFVGNTSTLANSEFDPDMYDGVSENYVALRISSDAMPDSALGYDGVDAIVWLDGNPASLEAGGSNRFAALREYVRRGGHLVINTPVADWQTLSSFGELMPVTINELAPRDDIDLLKQTALRNGFRPPLDAEGRRTTPRNPWESLKGPFFYAKATPKPGAMTEFAGNQPAVLDWDNDASTDADQTPWLVRRPLGYGCVSWVAQDLGDGNLIRASNYGWLHIWDLMLGSKSRLDLYPQSSSKQRLWAAGAAKNFGYSVLRGMDLSGRSAALFGVAAIFLVGYWLVAGPGAYFALKTYRKSHLNWFVFGALALLATLFTLGVVKLLLGGPPQVRHYSIVRTGMTADTAMVLSRLGMYVPRDARETITTPALDNSFTTTLTNYPSHPAYVDNQLLVRTPKAYTVTLPAAQQSAPPSLEMDFRTTQKQLRLDYFGKQPARVGGSVQAIPRSNVLGGSLTLQAGADLRNVYLAYRTARGQDVMMYLPAWKDGTTIEPAKLWEDGDTTTRTKGRVLIGTDVNPSSGQEFARGFLDTDWAPHYNKRLGAGVLVNQQVADWSDPNPDSVPVLSLFSRLAPVDNVVLDPSRRVEFLRVGARDFDVGRAVLAGSLVIIGSADEQPLPAPLTVSGSTVAGAGRVIYQFVVPIDRSAK